jgi:hypothetical protein
LAEDGESTTRCTIDITSLVTRIAKFVGAMINAEVTYLPLTREYQTQISLDHFVQGHLMREGPSYSLFMCYPGYEEEVELPCSRLGLYSVKKLKLQMTKKESARHSVAGTRPMTRSRTKQAEVGPSQMPPPEEPRTSQVPP